MGSLIEWIWRFLVDFFVGRRITGELTVTGTDQAIYELPERPDFVEVNFADECTTPCDPGCDDTLSWDVKKEKKHKWLLIISWKVSGVRKIVWEVYS